MLLRLAALCLVAGAAVVAVPSSAQNMKPGLWQINHKMQSSNAQLEQAMAQMREHMANMSPEQRKAMEAMMAKHGVTMPSADPEGTIVMKMCMTKEMAAHNRVPIQHQGNCTHTQSPVVGNTMKISFQCTQPPASGEGQVTFNGDDAYALTMKITSTANGKPETVSMDATGKWLGANCGNIKPLPLPKAK